MWTINQAYIDGKFVTVSGKETIEIFNPATEQLIGTVTLPSRADARAAIAAATRAQSMLAKTSKAERIEMLKRLESAVLKRTQQIQDATVEEYGAPLSRARWISQYASQSFAIAAKVLESYDLTRQIQLTGRIDNMFNAMGHVVPSHLMDRNLYPFATLQATGVADSAGDRAFDDDEDCASPPPSATIAFRAAR